MASTVRTNIKVTTTGCVIVYKRWDKSIYFGHIEVTSSASSGQNLVWFAIKRQSQKYEIATL